MAAMSFQVQARSDHGELTRRMLDTGRLQVAGWLASADAHSLRKHLLDRSDWNVIFNHGDRLYEYGAAERAAISATQWSTLQVAVQNAGRHGFQYYYENIRVPERPLAMAAPDGDDLLSRFARFMNSEPVLDFARQWLGDARVAFADCQATCYRPGHFLTTHDDAVAGKGRLAAYVFNLSEGWRAEWGGLLNFVSDPSHIGEAWVPGFNVLNVLRVPQPHFVSMVTGLAPPDACRLAVTGWFRAAD